MGRRLPYGLKEMLSPELLRDIIRKAKVECHLIGVWLYVYTEPFLNPQLPELVKVVHSADLPSYISTNLNIERNIKEVMDLDPEMLMISCSGFTQSVYSKTHKGGDVLKLIANMRLAEKHRRHTHVRVLWHRYKSNEHELPMMRDYAESLGFKFAPYLALAIGHESALKAFADPSYSESQWDNFLVPMQESAANSRARRHWPCSIEDQVIVLGSDGCYRLCCAPYERHFPLTSFLDMPIAEFMRQRKQSPFCARCKSLGGHVYATAVSEAPLYSISHALARAYASSPVKLPQCIARIARKISFLQR